MDRVSATRAARGGWVAAAGEMAARGGRRFGAHEPQHPDRESARRRDDRALPERRAAAPRAGLSGAAPASGLGGQHEREMAAPNQSHYRAHAYQGRNLEVHRFAARWARAAVHLRNGREVGDHQALFDHDIAAHGVLRDFRDRLERRRAHQAGGGVHRRRRHLARCRADWRRAPEKPGALSIAMGVDRQGGAPAKPRDR